MKVLIIAWYFPPANTIAAVRLGGLASYLHRQGHDIRVITAKEIPAKQTLAVDFPSERVSYTRWADVNALPNFFAGIVKRALGRGQEERSGRPAEAAAAPETRPGRDRGLSSRIADVLNGLYVQVVNFPDRRIGWLPFATGAGWRLARDWRPDVVLASGPPFTTLLAGRLISARMGVPWVVEFRDRWSDDPYYPPPAWRRLLTQFVERRLVRSARAIVTVSEPWAETYRATFGKETLVVYNGYDETCSSAAGQPDPPPPWPLRIVYTGGIYPGRRDPTPLFQALRYLGEEADKVRIEFYGTDPGLVWPLAQQAGVADRITVHPEITHEEAVAVQRAADVLLLMQWNDPREQGNVPGKFFEYLGARRPILVLGLRDGVPATIVRERRAGCYGESPEEISGHLRSWIETKRREGGLPLIADQAREGFSRVDQYRKLRSFLEDLIQDD